MRLIEPEIRHAPDQPRKEFTAPPARSDAKLSSIVDR